MTFKSIPALLASLAALVALLAVPAAAPAAKVRISVGIGDQSPAMFVNKDFRALKIKKARYFISWNAIDNPDLIAKADAWLQAAKVAKVRPLFHLDGVFTGSTPFHASPKPAWARSRILLTSRISIAVSGRCGIKRSALEPPSSRSMMG